MLKSVETKRQREKEMVSQMITLYCNKKHHTNGLLCPECLELANYAAQRSEKCPFMKSKTFCSNCKVHCYKPQMREKIRDVMRFSGPRMIFHHPAAVIRHIIETKREKKRLKEKMKIKNILFIILGCIGLGLGAVGAVVPLLPAFPFLLLAAFSFAKGSERLHTWFIGTKLYKNNLESYIKGKGMTWKTKIRVMVMVTLLMTIGFVMMYSVPIGRIILACVWLFHIFYLAFGVKTIKTKEIYDPHML